MTPRVVYQRRRAAWLWLPLLAIGGVVNAWSYTLTLTLNGASLAGMALIAAGTLALALDSDRGDGRV